MTVCSREAQFALVRPDPNSIIIRNVTQLNDNKTKVSVNCFLCLNDNFFLSLFFVSATHHCHVK